jgi:hypothetical protein
VIVDANCDLDDPLEILLSNLSQKRVLNLFLPRSSGQEKALCAVDEVSTHITKA